jgi:hypothetical protein
MRKTAFCPVCETTVYADEVHSCYDAAAVRHVRAVQDAREAVVRTGLAWFAALEVIRASPYSVAQSIEFRAKESDHREALRHLATLTATEGATDAG